MRPSRCSAPPGHPSPTRQCQPCPNSILPTAADAYRLVRRAPLCLAPYRPKQPTPGNLSNHREISGPRCHAVVHEASERYRDAERQKVCAEAEPGEVVVVRVGGQNAGDRRSSRQTHALHDDGKRRCASFWIECRNNPHEIWQTEHPCEVESHGRSDEHDRAAIYNEKQQAARREGESQWTGQYTPAARPEEGHENSTQKTRESR